MDLFNKAGIDIYAFVILLFLLLYSYSRVEWSSFNYRLFFYLVFTTMFLLILKVLFWGLSFYLHDEFLNESTFNSLILIFSPFPPLIWATYAHYQLFEDEAKSKSFFYKISIPIVINTVIIITAPVYPLLLIPFFSTLFICFFYMVFTLFMTIGRTGKIDKKRFSSIILFSIPPVLGAMVDMSFKVSFFLWPSAVISILFIYFNIQHYSIKTDPLTGLLNRRQLEARLDRFISMKRVGTKFGLFLMDIKGLKKININFGNAQGDKILEDTANILKSCFRVSDFVARFEGDDFIAVTKVHSDKDMEEISKRVTKAFDIYNQTALVKVSLSIGYSIYEDNMDFTSKEFIDYVSDLKYLERPKQL